MKNRKKWLEERKRGLGGSDAGIILGLNPWKNEYDLWMEKTYRANPEDISDKPVVQYGLKAEKHLIELFKLDYPNLEVTENPDNKMEIHPEYEYIRATVDGYLKGESDEKGILEIKTTTLRNKNSIEEWNEKVPETYYAQILHYMNVLKADFGILRVLKKNIWSNKAEIEDYTITRAEAEEDLKYLLEKEVEWWNRHIVNDEPPTIKMEI